MVKPFLNFKNVSEVSGVSYQPYYIPTIWDAIQLKITGRYVFRSDFIKSVHNFKQEHLYRYVLNMSSDIYRQVVIQL